MNAIVGRELNQAAMSSSHFMPLDDYAQLPEGYLGAGVGYAPGQQLAKPQLEAIQAALIRDLGEGASFNFESTPGGTRLEFNAIFDPVADDMVGISVEQVERALQGIDFEIQLRPAGVRTLYNEGQYTRIIRNWRDRVKTEYRGQLRKLGLSAAEADAVLAGSGAPAGMPRSKLAKAGRIGDAYGRRMEDFASSKAEFRQLARDRDSAYT